MASYEFLCRAQLSREYLYASSTSHESLFGAMAEMLDNSRDANATKVEVFTLDNDMQRGGFLLCFLDNGEGMTPSEASHVITFGKSLKKDVDSQIGHYGTGLKSGSMRLGNDMLLLTKKSGSQTCIFLSRTFLEEEQLEEVIVPIPSFRINTMEPLEVNTDTEKKKFAMEMEIILKYSPFHSETELLELFNRIPQNRGTLVIVFNLKLVVTGEPELDIRTVQGDILLSQRDDDMLPEHYSFRHFTSILYYPPRMKIYIQEVKVLTIPLPYSLYKPRHYMYCTTRFRNQSSQNIRQIAEAMNLTRMKLLEAESKMKQLEKESFANLQNRVLRAKYSKSTVLVSQLKEEIRLNKHNYETAQKLLKKPKMLKFIFGINIQHRAMHGVFIYTSGRLIKAYHKLEIQLREGLEYKGVLGLVDIPFSVLSPTSNKQDFVDEYEFKVLLHSMEDHMLQYWRDSDFDKIDMAKLWQTFGYSSDDLGALPSSDPRFVRRRNMETPIYIQCDKCLKWRILPYSSSSLRSQPEPGWTCRVNPDSSHNTCSTCEEVWHCPEGRLKATRGRQSGSKKSQDCTDQSSQRKKSLQKPLGTSNLMYPDMRTAFKSIYASLADTSESEEEPVAKKRSCLTKRGVRKKKKVNHEDQERAATSDLVTEQFQEDSHTEQTASLSPDMEQIILNYKRALCYFHNPSWSQDIEQIENLNVESLSKFPFNDLLLSYERHLGMTLRNYQARIDETKQELDELQYLISTLLTSIDGGLKTKNGSLKFNIQALLKACLEQLENAD